MRRTAVMRSCRAHPRLAGFTLIEMMVTIAVLVILLAIVAPSFRQVIANQRIKTAAFDLFSALSYARSEAVKRNTSVTLQAGATTNGGWTTGWRVVDPTDSTKYLRSWGTITNLAVNEAASLTSVTYGNDGRLTPGSTAPKFQIDMTSPVSGVAARCVQVDLGGRPTSATGACL